MRHRPQIGIKTETVCGVQTVSVSIYCLVFRNSSRAAAAVSTSVRGKVSHTAESSQKWSNQASGTSKITCRRIVMAVEYRP